MLSRVDNRVGKRFRKLLTLQMEGGMESDSVRKSKRMRTNNLASFYIGGSRDDAQTFPAY